jgi:hypothetical protein
MAAGLGFKTFATGDVLTAADTNGYLMQGVWVFANAAARTAAVTSPVEGNMSYLSDTNSTEYYSGSAWVAIGGGAATSGLNLISTTSLSSVSSQSINSCFSSTYTNYLVILSTTGTSAAGASFTMKLRASGTDSSSTYGAYLMGLNSAGTTVNNTGSSTSFYLTESHSSTTAGYNYAMVNLINPNLASETLVNIQSLGLTTAAGQFLTTTGSGIHTTASAYDGFTIIRSSGTFSGAISVYGYGK